MRKTDWSAELVENHGCGIHTKPIPQKDKSFIYSSDEHCRHISLTDIQTATNNYDHALTIGTGNFGNSYKGSINGSNTMVAIKRLDPGTGSRHQFKTQIELLSQLRHPHLVSLIGYCTDKGEMILVYDYMINGTLCDHLYETDNDPLPWKQRLELCIGAAKGLHPFIQSCHPQLLKTMWSQSQGGSSGRSVFNLISTPS